jgi:hypothetical protein
MLKKSSFIQSVLRDEKKRVLVLIPADQLWVKSATLLQPSSVSSFLFPQKLNQKMQEKNQLCSNSVLLQQRQHDIRGRHENVIKKVLLGKGKSVPLEKVDQFLHSERFSFLFLFQQWFQESKMSAEASGVSQFQMLVQNTLSMFASLNLEYVITRAREISSSVVTLIQQVPQLTHHTYIPFFSLFLAHPPPL